MRSRGQSIIEFSVVLAVALPLLVVLTFVGIEVTHYFAIRSTLDVGARKAARELVTRFNDDGTKMTNVDFLKVPNFIASSNQFNVQWDTVSPPAFVTVSCTYPTGGANGLPPFPNGPLRYFCDACQFDLGNLTVSSTFTMPVQ